MCLYLYKHNKYTEYTHTYYVNKTFILDVINCILYILYLFTFLYYLFLFILFCHFKIKLKIWLLLLLFNMLLYVLFVTLKKEKKKNCKI